MSGIGKSWSGLYGMDESAHRNAVVRNASKDKNVIRLMKTSEHRKFFEQIRQDFTEGEYPPYFVLHQQMLEGDLEGLVFIAPDGTTLAYALNAAGNSNGHILVSLLAVMKESRGTGIGSAFVAGLVKRYRGKACLIAEVEKPETASDEKERNTRIRRIRFYERAGFLIVPGIDYSIWGVPMHLMLMHLQDDFESLLKDLPIRMREVYLDLMGNAYIHQMVFRKVCE